MSKIIDGNEIEKDVETLIDGDRIINFSDSVFAFAATLLILKIDLPRIPPETLNTQFYAELFKLAPQYAANMISFLIIAYYWRLHHKLFILIKRYDNKLIWLNIFILIFVSFLPFPIDLFGDYPNILPVLIFYTISIAIVGFLILILWIYAAWNNRLIDRAMGQRTIWYHTISIAIAPVVFMLSIPLAMVDHSIGKLSWVFVIILLFLFNTFYKIGKKQKKSFNPEPI